MSTGIVLVMMFFALSMAYIGFKLLRMGYTGFEFLGDWDKWDAATKVRLQWAGVGAAVSWAIIMLYACNLAP